MQLLFMHGGTTAININTRSITTVNSLATITNMAAVSSFIAVYKDSGKVCTVTILGS